ncbi:MAG: ParB N-terminal domain-containing protein [Faecalibacillus sp.]
MKIIVIESAIIETDKKERYVMRIKKINYQYIHFEYKQYSQSLYDSIKRIGLSFPIKVNMIDHQYYCIDGHKRLSAIQDLLKNEKGYEKRQEIPFIIYNDGSTRSNDCWRSRNTH